ncbi:hypothetical protein ZIOFF_015453 [Zingiber officinale]|uniref:hAT-like transposase RNase-H fold domain-containing protein n=1 Tax=Zingiber officinale TaxID=94328 RepID=A0A8J5LMG0_ZINOF|nr:hypothetical protein ZIOFF_015453 [Zingiber officinale]
MILFYFSNIVINNMNSQPIDLDQEENSEEEEPEGAPAVSTTTRDLNVDEEMSSQGKASGSGKRKRVLKSKWWQYFEMLPKIEGEDLRCKCKACGITYKAESSIVDPRFKMQFVEFCYNKLYGHGSNELSLVRSKLVSLFEEYMHMGIASKVSTSSASSSSHSVIDDNASHALNLGSGCMDVLKEFDTFQSLEFIGRAQKSQLELYLEEPTIDRITKLDVLGFWKAHKFSAMKPDVVEALVCCRDWLAGGKVLLVINSTISFIEENNAGNAAAVLQLLWLVFRVILSFCVPFAPSQSIESTSLGCLAV